MNRASRTCIQGVAGWVEQLDVNTTGEMVTAVSRSAASSRRSCSRHRPSTGRATEHRRVGISSAVIASGRTRLTVLGMAPDEIDAIEQSGEPRRLVTVVAPRSGVVVNRGVTAGTSVDPSTTLLTIADLSRVWVLAEVPEANIPGIRVGRSRTSTFLRQGASHLLHVWTSSIRRSPTARARCASLLGGQSGRQPRTGPLWNGGL